MNKNFLSLALLLVFLALFISACGLLSGPVVTPEGPEAVYTQAAQTVQVQLTQQALSTLVAQLTQVAPTATAQASQATLQPTPTPTVFIPQTGAEATATTRPQPTSIPPTPLPCNWATFVKDVTISDGTTFMPNAEFKKTWRLKNIGTCTWDSDYTLVFVNGDRLSGAKSVNLPGRVDPGESVDVSVSLQAPTSAGHYRGYWMLRSDDGELFGIGSEASGTFWVDIRVSVPANDAYAYDLAAHYCDADWSSATDDLACQGNSDDRQGSVNLLTDPALESRTENELALWVRPNNGNDGWISGQFPAYKVKDGDHFLADIGCLAGNQGCDVYFDLDYESANGVVKNLGSWHEIYDGKTTRVDIDLSGLAGKSIALILTTRNNGAWKNANAFWFVPHIQSMPVTTGLVLSFRQEGGIAAICDDLDIYLTGSNAGDAKVYSCLNGREEVAMVRLNAEQAKELSGWSNQYKSFVWEQDSTGSPDGMLRKIRFEGQGSATLPEDIRAEMEDLATTLLAAASTR